jgi:hypothetical protein
MSLTLFGESSRLLPIVHQEFLAEQLRFFSVFTKKCINSMKYFLPRTNMERKAVFQLQLELGFITCATALSIRFNIYVYL